MSKEKKYIFDDHKNVTRLLRGLYLICIILFILDFFISRHPNNQLETIWGFYALYGFISCVVLVLLAKWMRKFLKRSENYYTKHEFRNNNSNGEQHVDD
jgi:archaellum component FlaD/FlaE